MKKTKRANGGNARAKKLSPARRSEIAKKAAAKRWGVKPVTPEQDDALRVMREQWERDAGSVRGLIMPDLPRGLRDEIAIAVLNGLYANIDMAQLFAKHVHGDTIPLPEALTRIAYAQADETLRLRAL